MDKRFKQFVSIFMVVAIVIAMTAACGDKEEVAAEPEQATIESEDAKADAEETARAEGPAEDAETPEENATEEVEMTEEQKAAEAEREAMMNYAKEIQGFDVEEFNPVSGIPEEKLQELYSAIQNAVKEEYLVKYNVAPSDFQWPSNEGGKGVPKPWMYLNEKVDDKLLFYEDPVMDLQKYDLTEADSQTIELMDIIYRQIIAWIENNGYADLMSVKWHKMILENVTIVNGR